MFGRRQRNVLLRSLRPFVKELAHQGLDADAVAEKVQRAVAEAMPSAVDESAAVIVADLHRRAAELKEHRQFDQAFKRRLATTWRRPFLLYEMVLTCASEAGSDFNDAHRRRAAKEGDFRFDVLNMLHARSCLVASETLELMKGGYPYGAHARCRTLYELAVFANVIGSHDQHVAERFLLHTSVEDASFVDSYQTWKRG